MGTTASTDRSGMKEVVPPWVYTVKIPPEFAADHVGTCSDGMIIVGPNTVTRNRTGHFDADGCKWNRGFTSGKHTFEIVFPMACRGVVATVGVATEEAPVYAKGGRIPLVGHNRHSWGICLRNRRAYHRNALVKKYPSTMVYLPDKFYMYLDVDGGKVQFGSDLDYYGTAISGLPKQQPLYPMVSATTQGANITIVYRGRGDLNQVAVVQHPMPGAVVPAPGDASAIGPPPPAVVPAGPQMMSPTVVAIHTHCEPPPPPPSTVVSNTVPNSQYTESEPAVNENVIDEKEEQPAEHPSAPAEEKPEEAEPEPEAASEPPTEQPAAEPEAEAASAPAEEKPAE